MRWYTPSITLGGDTALQVVHRGLGLLLFSLALASCGRPPTPKASPISGPEEQCEAAIFRYSRATGDDSRLDALLAICGRLEPKAVRARCRRGVARACFIEARHLEHSSGKAATLGYKRACASGAKSACRIREQDLERASLERRCWLPSKSRVLDAEACVLLAARQADTPDRARFWLDEICRQARRLPSGAKGVPAQCREESRSDPMASFALACRQGQPGTCGLDPLAKRVLQGAQEACAKKDGRACGRAAMFLHLGQIPAQFPRCFVNVLKHAEACQSGSRQLVLFHNIEKELGIEWLLIGLPEITDDNDVWLVCRGQGAQIPRIPVQAEPRIGRLHDAELSRAATIQTHLEQRRERLFVCFDTVPPNKRITDEQDPPFSRGHRGRLLSRYP